MKERAKKTVSGLESEAVDPSRTHSQEKHDEPAVRNGRHVGRDGAGIEHDQRGEKERDREGERAQKAPPPFPKTETSPSLRFLVLGGDRLERHRKQNGKAENRDPVKVSHRNSFDALGETGRGPVSRRERQ